MLSNECQPGEKVLSRCGMTAIWFFHFVPVCGSVEDAFLDSDRDFGYSCWFSTFCYPS